jgi:hypothetical protein
MARRNYARSYVLAMSINLGERGESHAQCRSQSWASDVEKGTEAFFNILRGRARLLSDSMTRIGSGSGPPRR